MGFLAAGFLAAGFLAAGFLAFFSFFGVLTFLATFLGDFLAAGFLAAGFLAAGFLATLATFSTLASLNEPDAPVPLTWVSLPSATAFFKNRRTKGASFSMSTLYPC